MLVDVNRDGYVDYLDPVYGIVIEYTTDTTSSSLLVMIDAYTGEIIKVS